MDKQTKARGLRYHSRSLLMQNQIYANSDQIVPCWSKLGFVSNDIDTLNCDKSNFIVNKMDKFYFYLDCNDKE